MGGMSERQVIFLAAVAMLAILAGHVLQGMVR